MLTHIKFQHGEDFAEDSAYGRSLTEFGIAQQKIARMQDKFLTRINEDVLLNMERSLAAMKEYQAARKKLESRRLTYDSALGKVQKARKEDSKLEEELRTAKIRYEELSDDVKQRMLSIREAESDNLRDILTFVAAEAEYFEAARVILSTLQRALSQELPLTEEHEIREQSQGVKSVGVEGSELPLLQSPSNPQSIHAPSHLSRGGDELLSLLDAAHDSAELSYVVRQDSSSSTTSNVVPQASTVQSEQPSTGLQKKMVRANFAFNAENPNEISIKPGDTISVVNEVSGGWWEGAILDTNGQPKSCFGLFPANYCSILRSRVLPPRTLAKATLNISVPSSMPEQHINGSEKMISKSHTFPRDMKQSATMYEPTVLSTRAKPPPPPVPSKRHPAK